MTKRAQWAPGLRQMQFPAGGNLWQTRTYHAWNGSSGNGNGRLWEIRIGTSATETSNTNYNKLRLGYAYDSGACPELGRRGSIIASSEQFSLGSWPQYRHCYACPELSRRDDQNRLVRGYHQYATTPSTIPACNTISGGQVYAYDKAGRLTSYKGATYNSYDGHAIQKSGYSYDARGSLTSRAGNTLVWNHENRLQQVNNSAGGTIESYLYDDNGIRVKRTAGGASTYFPSPYYELAGATPIKYYFFGGQRIAQKNGSTLYYLHQDHLGSTVLTTGAADATKTYRAYGNQRGATGSIATRHQFTDQYLDDTGLVYMNARVRPSLLETV